MAKTKRAGICGKEEKLGSHVFSYGHVAQAGLYIKTMEELSEYAGER